MGKIKGWNKLIDKPKRVYWENPDKKMMANVEKVGNHWTFTKGTLGERAEQVTDTAFTKDEGMRRAVNYMRFHDDSEKSTPYRLK